MPRFVWSSDYDIGIKVIDQQHQRIVDYINQVYAAPKPDNTSAEPSTARAALKEVLTNLVDYTYSHFAFEEAMLEEVEYTDLQEHQLTHQNFRSVVEQMRARCDGGDDVSNELAELLQKWLIQHILTDDRRYAAVIKQRLPETPSERQLNWVQTAIARYFH